MRYIKAITLLLVIQVLTFSANTQDIRTTETKVADLLSQMPARDAGTVERLMNDMLSLGDAGMKMICNQVLPAGSGDNVRPRFAVESMSRHLSRYGMEAERARWEMICISFVESAKDYTVKDFFMKQLQTIGGEASVEAVRVYLTDKNLCSPAAGVLASVKGATAERILSEALTNMNLPCAASVMNTLASMKSELAVSQFIAWSQSKDIQTKAAAYRALAQSGSPEAYPVLSRAAKGVSYKWEYSGATASLLAYTGRIAEKGDIANMEKICKTLIARCNSRTTIQFKSGALETLVKYKGTDAMSYLIEAASHPEKSYRNKSMQLSLTLPGIQVTRKWIDYFPKAPAYTKPEIILMLGERKDETALPLIVSSLGNPDSEIRKEAVAAIVKIKGRDAIPELVSGLMKNRGVDDQEAIKSALVSVIDSRRLPQLLAVLEEGPDEARRSVIEILAWSRQPEYFNTVIPFISSDNEAVRASSFKALPELVSADDQEKILELLSRTDNSSYVADLQMALSNAANQVTDPEKRSELILRSPLLKENREKIIPVLANTGGREALKYVLDEYENGRPEMREICFRTLTSWKDHTVASALYEICASGNKTYEAPAFNAYVRVVRTAPVTPEQKLLLYRKIMTYANSAERKNVIINELGKIKTYQSLFFTARYLDDPETSAAAARAAMYIALPTAESRDGMCGILVREILGKVITKLTGTEIEYERELIRKYLASLPPDEGFVPMFNGRNLTGWQGLVGNPVTRAKMSPAERAKLQAEANKKMLENWSVKDGCIWFSGSGDNLCSIKEYGDFELLVDWLITRKGDSGIYLRGSPQVQIWDTSRVEVGAQVGSGGLYNNQKNPSKPLVVADNPVGEWNTFRIVMIGEKVSVWLNGILVVDNVVLENYWDRSIPIFPKGSIELQAHGTDLAFRDIYVREIVGKGKI